MDTSLRSPVGTGYDGYLRLDALLALQVPRSDPPAHDELMFIVAHQTYELWFKVLLHELEGARDRMVSGRLRSARQSLVRAIAVQQVLLRELDVLETLDPQDFLAFRTELGSASGSQSVQFGEIEVLAGSRDGRALDGHRWDPSARSVLADRLAQPSVWDAFIDLLPPPDPVAADTERELLARLLIVARDRDRYASQWELAQSLLAYDRLAAQWRFRHIQLVECTIGRRRGTGGTAGASHLRRQADLRYYPLLWELPSVL